MKQMSTGFGLAVLGACVLGAAFIASPRFGQQAFAQSTGDRRIVSASVYATGGMSGNGLDVFSGHYGYRIWSDNEIEIKFLGYTYCSTSYSRYYKPTGPYEFVNWTEVDNGLTSFVPADVDANQSVDAADLGSVLSHYGETQDGNPPPPIDCTINAPR